MKELKSIYGYGVNDSLTINDDGYLKSHNVVTLQVKDGYEKTASIAISVDRLIESLNEIKELEK